MIIVLILLAVVFTVFVLENQGPVTVEFIAWRYDTRLGIAVVIAMLIGALVVFIASMARQYSFQSQMRDAETRARNAEAKLKEIERQREMFTTEER